MAAGELKPKVEPAAPKPIEAAITDFMSSKRTDGRSKKTLIKYEGELRSYAKYLDEHERVTTLDGITVETTDRYRAKGDVRWA